MNIRKANYLSKRSSTAGPVELLYFIRNVHPPYTLQKNGAWFYVPTSKTSCTTILRSHFLDQNTEIP